MRHLSWFLPVVLLCVAGTASAQEGYYREPALHGNTLVFVSEGDLWKVAADGGRAQRLTTHPGAESQPVISPDGAAVAFIASYDGTPDIYLMPLAGGEPRRLSFDGGPVHLAGFNPQGEIVFASDRLSAPGFGRVLRAVNPQNGAVRELPLADAREAAWDAAGDTLWFTRFGLAVSGDHARHYRGGAMAQLWRWQGDERVEAERVAAPAGANAENPMWWQGRLYAVSDADGQDNLWALDAAGGEPRQLTRHADFGVREARLDAGRIVYRLGADLRMLDLASGTESVPQITLDSDFLQRRVRYLDEPGKWIGEVHLGAGGRRVAIAARGQAMLAGTKELRRVELAVPADARVRSPLPSPDGAWVYAITDREGRSEIWRYAANGTPDTRILVPDEGVHRWRLWVSPDGHWLAHADKQARLWLLDLRGGSSRLLDESPWSGDDAYNDVAWSADSRHLAWSRPASSSTRSQLLAAAVAGGTPRVLTSDRYESFDPAFSPDGHWLYFLSRRHFMPTPGSPWGDRNTGAMFDQRVRIYALALQAGQRFPFAALDELAPEPENGKDGGKRGADAALPAIAWTGLAERLHELPLGPGNYARLAAAGERLYFLERASGARRADLKSLAIRAGNDKAVVHSRGVADFELDGSGKRLLVVQAGAKQRFGEILLLDAGEKAPGDTADARVRLGGWNLRVDPAQEWRQMFVDAWQLHRRFAFDPAMRGLDWDAVRARFEPLLARVNDRLELDDLLGQMTGELDILHSQVRGGDYREDSAAPGPASLGAELRPATGGMLVAHLYRTDPELPSARGPLQQPAVDVREGDVITAINGRPVAAAEDVARELRGQAGQQVLLSVRRGEAGRDVVVRPVSPQRDMQLRYSDWMRGNAARVEEAGGGRIGYVHLYSMVSPDFAGFVREFYAQYDREGLIIDVRRNRGGNIDSWVIEKLLRRAWEFWQPPHGRAETNMQQTFRGHLVVLADAFTYSDGETFTAAVKSLGLGPVIGQRTAGAGIWLSDRNRLRDGGLARVAESGQFDLEGRWIIEGRGVAPDIEVENLPLATAQGRDAQLERALQYLAERLEAEPLAPLRAGAITPVGQPAEDVRPLPR